MKKLLIAAIFSILILSIGLANAAMGSDINIVLTSQNPYPVEPGSNVEIEIEIQNNGYAQAEGVRVEIVPREPFTLAPGEEKVKTFTRIAGKDSVKTKYKLYVSRDAITDSYDIEFRVSELPSSSYSTEKVSVSVQGKPDLIIEGITTSPSQIEPGNNVEMEVSVKNIGSGTAHDVKLVLSPNTTYILPVFSRGETYLGDIKPGITKMATFKINVDTEAEEKTYESTIIAEYGDESNSPSTETFSIGIPVKGSIVLSIVKIEPDYNRKLTRIEIANKGTTTAKSVEAKLVVGNKTAGIDYVSELKANRKTTLDFPLVEKSSGRLIINYIGPGTEKNMISKEVSIDFAPEESNNTIAIVVVLAVLGILSYTVWRRVKKRK